MALKHDSVFVKGGSVLPIACPALLSFSSKQSSNKLDSDTSAVMLLMFFTVPFRLSVFSEKVEEDESSGGTQRMCESWKLHVCTLLCLSAQNNF